MQYSVIVSNLTHDYGERRALSDVSFIVSPASFFGLLGPNGCGKTTIFTILSTLLPPASGDVTILDFPLRRQAHAIRAAIGVVFQRPSIDGRLTVRENLLHQGPLYGIHGRPLSRRIDCLLEQFGLLDRSREPAANLSGGLRRRLEIAKSLLHAPRLLILDEPSTGLDPVARNDLHRSLVSMQRDAGCTILLTTHLMEEAEQCDHIAILDGGRIVADGSPASLISEIGGDMLVVKSRDPHGLRAGIRERFGLTSLHVGDELHIEHPRGHEFIPPLVEAFRDGIISVMLSTPTLEDVFIAHTGHAFAEREGNNREKGGRNT